MVIIATDVLQEGEDLHTFCSDVIHYGIAWTPTAIEQKTGRVDRVGSLTSRRLMKLDKINENDKLQVYFPYIKDTFFLARGSITISTEDAELYESTGEPGGNSVINEGTKPPPAWQAIHPRDPYFYFERLGC